MNFETIHKKYKEGSATEEERAFIESEIEKARKFLLENSMNAAQRRRPTMFFL